MDLWARKWRSTAESSQILGYGHTNRVHELGCYLETELSSYVGVLRAWSTLQKERIRVRHMHGSASVG